MRELATMIRDNKPVECSTADYVEMRELLSELAALGIVKSDHRLAIRTLDIRDRLDKQFENGRMTNDREV